MKLRSNRIIRHMWKHLGLALASCTFRPVDPTPTSQDTGQKSRINPTRHHQFRIGIIGSRQDVLGFPSIQEPANDFGFSNKNNVPNSLSHSVRAKLSLNKALSLSLSLSLCPDQLLIPCWIRVSPPTIPSRLTPRSVSKFLILARFLEEPLPRY